MKIAFDTNIIISRKVTVFPRNHYFSPIVMVELVAATQNKTGLKFWEATRIYAEKFDRFLVPTAEDWWETGKALQRLSQGSKRENFGSTPKVSPEKRNRLFNDVLLAVSCRRAGITVVTDNLKDFERIGSVCRIKFSSGDAFFTPPDASA